MKISYFTVPLVLSISILTGCTSMTPRNSTANSTPAKVTPVENADASIEQSAILTDKENYPSVELTREIFLQVMFAEVAFQRGDFPAAYSTNMALGQQTRDSRFPKRALEMSLQAKQSAQAFYASRIWHEYAPKSDEAIQYYLGFLIVNSDYSEAKSVVGKYLEDANPKERGAMLLQSGRWIMRGPDKQSSFDLMEELVKPYPDYFEAHLALAQAAYLNNNTARAMTEARAALAINPASQIAVATVAQLSPVPDDALKILADFLARYPDATDTRRVYAGLLVEHKQYEQARSQFQTVLNSKPDDSAVLYTLGVLSLQLNDIPSAEKNLKAFVALTDNAQPDQRDPTTAFLYLSQIADDRKDGVAALDWVNKIQSYDGKNAAYFNAQLRRAILISKYESLDKAREFLHELKGNPEEQIQITQLDAELLRNANHNQEAMSILQGAIKNYPDNSELLYDYAMMAEKLDRIDDMEKALRHVIAINPENQHAYNALGYSLADRNIRLPEARVLIEKALSLAPDDAFIIDSMGWLEFRENKTSDALMHLQRAYQLRPDADIAAHVGEVLWTLGEQKKAIAIWKEARQKDPDNAALKSTLDRLKVNL